MSSLTAGVSYAERPRIPIRRRLGRLARQNPIGAFGLLIIVLVLLTALFADRIATHNPIAQDAKRLLEPSAEHWFGTDELGRDEFSRIIHGSRVSLQVGVIAVSLALAIGLLIGLSTGYVGGWYDTLLMRFVDLMFAFPGLVLAIVITGLLGPSITNAMIAIGITYAPTFARVVRSAVLTIRNELYVEAARVVGGSDLHIVSRYIMPNMIAPVIVLATLQMSTAILTEAALSFLGLGTQPPYPSWGLMLNLGRPKMEIAPWLAIFPGVAIVVAVLGFNFLGDGLRDALDPRLRE